MRSTEERLVGQAVETPEGAGTVTGWLTGRELSYFVTLDTGERTAVAARDVCGTPKPA